MRWMGYVAHDRDMIRAGVLVDLAVAIADGAEAINDIAVLAGQPAVFGPVASNSTCWRLPNALDQSQLAAVAVAHARAREEAGKVNLTSPSQLVNNHAASRATKHQQAVPLSHSPCRPRHPR